MKPDRIDNSHVTPFNLTNSIDDLEAGVMVTKNIIGYIKNLQFPKSSLPWLATLSFLPLALYFRFVIGTSLVLYKDLDTYTQTAWILGLIFLLWLIWKWFFDDRFITTGLENIILAFFIASCLSTAFSDSPASALDN